MSSSTLRSLICLLFLAELAGCTSEPPAVKPTAPPDPTPPVVAPAEPAQAKPTISPEPAKPGIEKKADVPAAPASLPIRLEDRELDDLLTELLAAADEGNVPVTLVQHLGQRGMPAGVIAAKLAAENPKNEARLNALCDVASLAGRMRRHPAGLLQLYDPTAFEVFYGPDRVAKQQSLRGLSQVDKWPRELPAALVTAAPLVALDWLKEQAQSPQPATDNVRKVCRKWGEWCRQNNERQYRAELATALAALLNNPAITAEPATYIDVLRAAGECYAEAALGAATKALAHDDPQVRKQAASTLGRLGTSAALEALVACSATEQETAVLADIAAALNHWPDDSKAGAALTALFARSPDEQVRREILFTVANAHWPERTAILQAAFAAPGQGALGVALLAMAGGVPGELREPTLALAKDLGEANPALIDALGAMKDPRAVPYLVHALQKELNTPLRLKAALALEKINTPEATAALLQALQTETDPLLVEHLVGIAGNLKLDAAEPTLIALAEDATAPMAIRVQAIWSLGSNSSSRAKQSIERMSENPQQTFGNPNDPQLAATDAERIELASLFLAFARWRFGQEQANAEIAERFREGSATTQLSCLMLLARLQRDHEVIAAGLASHELPILLAAVRAAGAADPLKYRDTLVKLRQSPWITALFDSSADTMNLQRDLDHAIAAGEPTK